MQASLKDLQDAVSVLPEKDYERFRDWFIERDWAIWDDQIRADSAAGRLGFLVNEAIAEKDEGKLRDL